MTPTELLKLLITLLWYPFKSKDMKTLQSEIITHLSDIVNPKLIGDFECVEVRIDKPDVKTTHKTKELAMDRVIKIRNDNDLYAVHIIRGTQIVYTWERGQK